MIMRTLARLLASALLCAGIVSSPASATTIEFTDWASTEGLVDVTYTVCDDCVAGNFLVSINIADPDALLTGLFIDLDPTILESAITIVAPSEPGIGDFDNGGNDRIVLVGTSKGGLFGSSLGSLYNFQGLLGVQNSLFSNIMAELPSDAGDQGVRLKKEVYVQQ